MSSHPDKTPSAELEEFAGRVLRMKEECSELAIRLGPDISPAARTLMAGATRSLNTAQELAYHAHLDAERTARDQHD